MNYRKTYTDYSQKIEKPFLSSYTENCYALQLQVKLAKYFPTNDFSGKLFHQKLSTGRTMDLGFLLQSQFHSPLLPNNQDFPNVNIHFIRCKQEIFYHGKMQSQMTISDCVYFVFKDIRATHWITHICWDCSVHYRTSLYSNRPVPSSYLILQQSIHISCQSKLDLFF